MATHRPVEIIKAVYAPNNKPIKPVRTENMDDVEWEEAQAGYKKEYEDGSKKRKKQKQ